MDNIIRYNHIDLGGRTIKVSNHNWVLGKWFFQKATFQATWSTETGWTWKVMNKHGREITGRRANRIAKNAIEEIQSIEEIKEYFGG